ncbi:MAG: energy-coupling factor transporter ATPase [Lachnospiraceae bacterium]|nr:energy-coupling factor transporter ATPase [Lachnospiraceae bacterium]
MIHAKDLVYEYIRRDKEENVVDIATAINKVNVDVEAGQFIVILGHNGSGKSTFAKHINGILTPSEGSLWVDGKKTNDMEKLWEIRQSAGMVFQNPDNQFVANLVEEDVGFGPENLGVEPAEIWDRVEESLSAVEMLPFRKKSPNRLSGGQKQRVAIAGIMAMRPKCIILDEPTAMLDPQGRKEVMYTIQKLNKVEGMTVVLITHYMDEVVYADKVFVMDHGSVVMEGTPREIFAQVDELKKYHLDVPQVTELAYELRKEGIPMPEAVLTIEEFMNAFENLKTKF